MRKSIFDLELRVNIEYEFESLKNILITNDSICYRSRFFSLYEFLNDEIFPLWGEKNLFIDFDDFCNRLDIDLAYSYITHENFLYLLELLINLWSIAETKISKRDEEFCSKKVLSYMRMNLPLIVEKLNYTIINDDGEFRIIKRDSDMDSVLNIVPSTCADLLLNYNDIRNNDIKSKKEILKELDLFIEEKYKKHKGNPIYESIGSIVNNLGINHPIKTEYKDISVEELSEWYDKCFKLMIHLIRSDEIKKIVDERNKLFVKNGK